MSKTLNQINDWNVLFDAGPAVKGFPIIPSQKENICLFRIVPRLDHRTRMPWVVCDALRGQIYLRCKIIGINNVVKIGLPE